MHFVSAHLRPPAPEHALAAVVSRRRARCMSRPVRRQRAPRYTVLPALARAPARVCMHFVSAHLFQRPAAAGSPALEHNDADLLAGVPENMDEDL